MNMVIAEIVRQALDRKRGPKELRCAICGSKAGRKLRGNHGDDETAVCANHYRQNVAKVVRLVLAGRFQQPRRKKGRGDGESNG